MFLPGSKKAIFQFSFTKTPVADMKGESVISLLSVLLGAFVLIAIVLLCIFRDKIWSLCSWLKNCKPQFKYIPCKDEESHGMDYIGCFSFTTELSENVESQNNETDENNDSMNRNRLARREKKIKDLGDELKYKEDTITALEADLRKERDEKDDALKRLTRCEKEIKDLGDELNNKKDKIRVLEADLTKERNDKDDALKRLSAIMSSRLRDGNPNVVDLSDQNRPLKVGEQFSELYDNQWTDAYSAMQRVVGESLDERRMINILVNILEQCFRICKTKAESQLDEVRKNVKAITAMITKKDSKLPDDLMQRIKEEKKMNAIDNLPEYQDAANKIKEYFGSQGLLDSNFIDNDVVGLYIKECLKLCYLMVNQDPPMAIVSRPDQNAAENFKAYQHRGSKILFVVWPALYLEAGGPLVSKGVAEFGD